MTDDELLSLVKEEIAKELNDSKWESMLLYYSVQNDIESIDDVIKLVAFRFCRYQLNKLSK